MGGRKRKDMKQGIFTIKSNRRLTESVYEMIIEGDTAACEKPGQFVNLKLDGFFLRRPISVCEYDEESIKLIYKTVGSGTHVMADMQPEARLDVLTGLGNGYDIAKAGGNPVLIGGGVGIPPLYGLLKELYKDRGCTASSNEKIKVILGFNSKNEMFYKEEFEKAGAELIITTADGSAGVKGFVTDALKDIEYSYFYTCGPEAMFRAIEKIAKTSGQYSFEERMGCGFGACMGCSCKTKYGNKRICKDGPVLEREEIIW